jgi:hypothetical protein
MAHALSTMPVSVKYIFKRKSEDLSDIVVDWAIQNDLSPFALITVPIILPPPEKHHLVENGMGKCVIFCKSIID